jgi:acetate kinase
MSTRSGTVDPGALLYLLREHGLTPAALEDALNLDSGLKGLAGGSGDMIELERRATAGDGEATRALDVFLHRLAAAVAAMTASLGGLDALAFTAGIGEHSAFVREGLCERLRFLGLRIDRHRNQEAAPDEDIAAPGSSIPVLVVHAREDLIAARAARALIASASAGPARTR